MRKSISRLSVSSWLRMHSAGVSLYTLVFIPFLLVTNTLSNVAHTRNSPEQVGRGSPAVEPVMSWQGFHFKWLRRELGFETPHRLGSVSSYISNFSSTCDTHNSPSTDQNCSVFGTYQVQFTPGVSGDYAYPVVHYQTIAAVKPSEIDITTGNTTFSVEDNSTTDPVLHADISRTINITLKLSEALPPHKSQGYQLMLQGFQVDMRCTYTPEHGCNSNAIWPYYFNLSLANPCIVLDQQQVAVCPLSFGLGRGWTPSHGGGKAYNYQMAYNVTVFFMRICYSTSSGTTMKMYRIAQKADIYQPPLSGQETLANTSVATQSAVLGLSEISWNLLQTDGYLNRGRYLEELVFSITPQLNPQTKSEISYTWTMGYRDPTATTYPSNVQYSMVVAALVTPKENLLISTASAANGSVCMDSEDVFTFHCSKLGLKSRTQDTVNIQGTL